MTIKKGDWVMMPEDPLTIFQITEVYADHHAYSGDDGPWTDGELNVVTSLPTPKLTKKELLAWLKAQNEWIYVASYDSEHAFDVTCAGQPYYHAKTLSSAIRKLRKAMGVV